MRKESSIKNILTSIIPYIFLTFLGFLRLKVMLGGLGEEIYALNQLFIQLFSYISLLEAGVGTLITQLYYKCFVKNDKKKICEIYSYSNKLLKKISLIMVICGLVISFALKIFTNNSLSLSYMQFVFILYLFKAILEYLMYAPRFVIIADQKSYKINLTTNIFKVIEMLVEIILLSIYKNYIIILLSTIVVRYITYYISNKKVYKEYPWLHKVESNQKLEVKKMGAVMTHKISGTVHNNTDILLASMFLKPIQVVIYSSYNYIVKFISDVVYMVGSSITASMGNVLYKDNKENQYQIFEKTNAIFIFFAMFFSVALYVSTNKFVVLWIGEDKLLPSITFLFMILTLFMSIAVRPFLIIRDSKALYKETKLIAIFEMLINLVLSLILVQKLGVLGLLIATVIASLFTTMLCYPIYIYKNYYNKNYFKYFIKLFQNLAATVFLCLIFNKFNLIMLSNNYFTWFLYSLIYCIIIFIVIFVFNIMTSKYFRQIVKELQDYLFAKIKTIGKEIISTILNLFFRLYKIDSKKIVFQSGRGMIDGNPKAIYEYINKNNAKNYKLIWLVTKDTNTSKLEGIYYNSNSIKGLYHLATAKYWIRSESLGSVIKKRKGQVYIQTWHGHGAMKKMGYDVNNEKNRPPLEHTKEWDHLLTNGPIEEMIMKSSTGYKGNIIQIGAPLTDIILKNANDNKFIKNLKKELKIPKNKKVILYAPTFRDKQLDMEKINLKIDALKNAKDAVILVRVHPLIRNKIDAKNFGKNFINVCFYPDVSDLLAVTDILISDYSSIIYQFSVLNRPIMFYTYDLDEYTKDRGFYINFPEDLPGEAVNTDEELLKLINNIDKYKKKISKKLNDFNRKYNANNDGKVCEKFTELLITGYFDK